uniref:DJ-1/PfpI domain-containing protein n=1 Tax=Panagrolaimus sp. PS1159 TaxID=55785 RepID=A0AC35FCH3_9BILA
MAIKILAIGYHEAEETELILTVDVLRRAEFDVTIACLDNDLVFVCDRKTTIKADKLFKDVENEMFDAVVLPGGPERKEFFKDHAENPNFVAFLKRHHDAGKLIGCICGSPVVLSQNKINEGGKMTSWPGDKEDIVKAGYVYEEMDVVVSNNIVTSRAPGTAFEFALKLVEILAGETKSMEIGKALLYIK